LGGIGKTQLAIEYAYRYVENYSLVWWIRAEEPTKLATEYSALAHYINLPEKNDIDQNKIIEGVRHWLEQNEKWLLIFDNAPNHTELRKYLPQRCNGHILITSRNPNWRGMASSLPLDVLERGESVDFLLKRTGKKDKISSKALAESLGDLPLALEQAGAYIEVTGISIADYLKFFQSYRKELLRRGKPSADYPDSVATTWEISFQKVDVSEFSEGDMIFFNYGFNGTPAVAINVAQLPSFDKKKIGQAICLRLNDTSEKCKDNLHVIVSDKTTER